MPLAPPIDAIQQPAVGIYGLPVGASAGAMVLLTAAQIRAHADLSGYVPYTGATGAVDLGSQLFRANEMRSNQGTSTWFRHDYNGVEIRGCTSPDAKLVCNSSGWRVLADSGLKIRNSANSADAPITCAAVTASGNLTLQNSTTAVLQTIEKTFTSATSREYIQSGWNATDSAYDVGVSYRGSAGGSLQAVRIGNRTAAGVFAGLTVATSGIVTTTSELVVTTASGAVTTSVYAGSPQISGAGSLFVTASSGNLLLRSSGTIALLPGNSATGTVYLDASVNLFPNIASTGNLGTAAKPWLSLIVGTITASGTILTRNSTSPTSIQITNTYTSATSFGLLDIRANAAQTAYEISSWLGSAGGAALPINIGHRDSAGTFTSGLSVATNGAITASGQITQTPPASVTLATNGQFSIEMTSDTAGNLVYRGSDGTTRRAALTFV